MKRQTYYTIYPYRDKHLGDMTEQEFDSYVELCKANMGDNWEWGQDFETIARVRKFAKLHIGLWIDVEKGTKIKGWNIKTIVIMWNGLKFKYK